MKKIFILIFAAFLLIEIFFVFTTNAATCRPAYNGNWGVTGNCDWPDGYKVYGDIYIGNYTITMGNNDDMGIDLNSKKITFNNGKINLATTAKISNHVSTRYYVGISYSTTGTGVDCDSSIGGNQCTHCPSGMHVFNRNSNSAPTSNGSSSYMGGTPKTMPSSGKFYCGTKGVANQ